MVTWKDVLEQEERRRDKLTQAEQYRLIKQLLRPERPPSIRFYYRFLSALGQRLEQWGCRLQARYQPPGLHARHPEPLLPGSATGSCGS